MTTKEIEKHNSEVAFNESTASWVIDIIATLIAWPMIILAIRRRAKYNKRIN